MRHFARAERGSALVELALALPMLILVLVGIVEFGRAVNAYVTISGAAREGARYAVLHPSGPPEDITAEVRARVVPLDSGAVSVTASYYDGTTFQPWPPTGIPFANPPRYIPARVAVSYPWSAASFIGSFFAQSVSFGASSTMDALR